MGNGHQFDEFRQNVIPALQSKREEFVLFGYGEVKEQDIWHYLQKKKWKKPQNSPSLHTVVNDILRLNVSEYMHFATIEAFKASSNGLDGPDAFKDLLG
ncbi:post-transcriptional regulator [Peribacillus alkalitolerans]|uniref:post-transcriptional regulator n=1 Tax=Peribacillus alkalitolerans TaxID=1550385 RepID=UPI0013D67839|nr:post-transcriptional regulator [Peribacillus alkalitolerans]